MKISSIWLKKISKNSLPVFTLSKKLISEYVTFRYKKEIAETAAQLGLSNDPEVKQLIQVQGLARAEGQGQAQAEGQAEAQGQYF